LYVVAFASAFVLVEASACEFSNSERVESDSTLTTARAVVKYYYTDVEKRASALCAIYAASLKTSEDGKEEREKMVLSNGARILVVKVVCKI
jgi:hypothetical protein